MIRQAPVTVAPLDPAFCPAALVNRVHRRSARIPLIISLERESGLVSRYETAINPDEPDALRYVERLVKFFLWARGGWKLYLGGPAPLLNRVAVRPFDAELMSRVYERPFEVVVLRAEEVPVARERNTALGGHLDGCRIGFDLGASDYKVAAVQEGAVVYSDE